jgi:hypothetical protein
MTPSTAKEYCLPHTILYTVKRRRSQTLGRYTALIRLRYGGAYTLMFRLYRQAAIWQGISTLALHLLQRQVQARQPGSTVRCIGGNAIEEPGNTLLYCAFYFFVSTLSNTSSYRTISLPVGSFASPDTYILLPSKRWVHVATVPLAGKEA